MSADRNTSDQATMHERISFNNFCFRGSSLADDVEHWRALCSRRIGVQVQTLAAEGWDPSVDLVRSAAFHVATMVHPFISPAKLDQRGEWEAARSDLARTLAAAELLGADTVYMTTGGRGGYSWEAAAQAFCEAVVPWAEVARRTGIELLIEPAPALYADSHLVHTLRDTVMLAEMAPIGVCIDIFSSWTEPGLRETVERAMPHCHLVQVSDYVLGDRSVPCRAVTGDGAIPLEQIIGWLVELGYQGAFDLELIGPRIDAQGHRAAAARTRRWLTDLMARLGA